MNKTELEKFHQALCDKKAELQALLADTKDAGRPVVLDQASVGRLSRMDAMQGQQMALETQRRYQQQLLKIEGTLRRMEQGDFGYCLECGEEMDVRRLGIDPTATRCVSCADA